MANLTATAPAAFDYFLAMVTAAVAAGADPTIFVVDGELAQYEPGTYIELEEIKNHKFVIDSLGSYAFLEDYDLSGVVRVYRGDINMEQARTDAWAIYQTYIMSPVIADKRLGSLLMYTVPASADGVNSLTSTGGCQHVITFTFNCVARVTV